MPPPGGGGIVGAHRQGTPCPRRGAKGDVGHLRFPMSPLDTPLTFREPRLPAVVRLKTRGPQGRLVFQGHSLDGSGAFRSRTPPPCTVWPRTDSAANHAREIQGITASQKLPDARNRAPVTPVSLRDRRESRRKGGFGGVKRGQGNHTVPLPPFVSAARRRQSPSPWARRLRRQTAAMPGLPIGSHSSPAAASRRNGGDKPSAEGKKKRLLPPAG